MKKTGKGYPCPFFHAAFHVKGLCSPGSQPFAGSVKPFLFRVIGEKIFSIRRRKTNLDNQME